jgi:arylformamidase
MEIIDISVPVRPGMVTYPGDPEVRLERVSSITDGAAYNLSRLAMGVHSGTHVDAPLHFLEGAPAADALALDVLVGPAHVVDATGAETRLSATALNELELPSRLERVLFKTRNSDLWQRTEFSDDFVSLTEDGARFLIERGARLVGIDYLSIGDEGAHVVLLEAGVVAIEGLDLRAVAPGQYQLICAPLKLVGAEGAPARALLVRDE